MFTVGGLDGGRGARVQSHANAEDLPKYWLGLCCSLRSLGFWDLEAAFL